MTLKKFYRNISLIIMFSTAPLYTAQAGFLDALRHAAGSVAHTALHTAAHVAAYTAGSALMGIGSRLSGGMGGYGMGYRMRPWGQGGNMMIGGMPPMGGMGMMGHAGYGGGYGGGMGGYGGGMGGYRR